MSYAAHPRAGCGADQVAMEDLYRRLALLSPERRALFLRRLRDEAAPERRLADDPVAIIGMACRLPGGADDPGAFWRVLRGGVDAIRRAPPGRSGASPNSDNEAPAWAGFLDCVDHFDASFFGISPREAAYMDPQHRLLLEVAWEALEDAGQPPPGLSGSRSGVFVSVYQGDYGRMAFAEAGRVEAYTGAAAHHSLAANRLSYVLDLRGPSLVIDTACSSSLVAVHFACRSLLAGECRLAVVGGVNLILSSEETVCLARWGLMAPDGRCKAFDARADGFVRGEGCGVLILKRLVDALADGDRILAVLRGTAVSQDGRSNGLTAPSSRAQEDAIRRALDDAAASPEELTYLEAHGTGTALGDPIEMEALKAVFGRPRPDGRPCHVGSVKTNIGHLEAAAGIAGLIKVVLALGRGEIPPNLHFQRLNPAIELEGTPLVIPTEARPWAPGPAPRLAGVSSFGMGGTNAHVVLEEALDMPQPAPPRRPGEAELVPLSARTPEALRAVCRTVARVVAGAPHPLAEIAATATLRRAHHEHRVAVVARSPAELAARLEEILRGELPPGTALGRAHPGPFRGLVFLFSGQGSQAPGMARGLLEREPAFRDALERCDRAIRAAGGPSPLDVLGAPGGDDLLDRSEVVQPLLFAVQVALAELLRAHGVEPDAVVGHSVGEVAAACVVGALDLDDAARVVCARSRLLARIAGQGGMLAAEIPLARAEALVARAGSGLSIGAENGPRSVVLSGDPGLLAEVEAELAREGAFCRRVRIEVASHSRQVEPLLGELQAALAGIRPAPAAAPFISTVTGAPARGEELDAAYWARNLRDPVRCWPAIRRLLDDGHRIVLEISPHPVLLQAIREGVERAGPGRVALGTLRRGEDDRASLLGALGALYALGVPLRWTALHPPAAPWAPLPAYPFQRERFWLPQGLAPSPSAAPATPRPAPPLFHAVRWVPREHAGPRSPAPAGWLLLAERGGLGERVAEALRETGASVALIPPDLVARPAAIAEAALAALPPGAPWDFAHLLALDAPPIEPADPGAVESAALRACAAALGLTRALTAAPGRHRLWIITRGAEPVLAGPVDPAQAPLAGLARVIAAEHPERYGAALDLPPEAGASAVAALLLEEACAPGAEPRVAYRGGCRYVARLAPLPALPPASPLRLLPDAAYLLTGGLGGLGQAVARRLIERGARHLVLLGRSADRAPQDLDADVRVVASDVADEAALRSLFDQLDREGLPVRGVIHAAGLHRLTPLERVEPEELAEIFRPKVQGALALCRALGSRPLDVLVLFSSAATLLGSPFTASYTAANAFLDALAHALRARGLPAISVDWGAWEEIGLAARLARERGRSGAPAHGTGVLSPALALDALERILSAAPIQIGVFPFDGEAWRAAYPLLSRSPYYEDLLRGAAAEPAPPDDGPPTALRERLTAAAEVERADALLTYVRDHAARALRLAPARLDLDRQLPTLGVDSLMAVELKARFEQDLGVSLTIAEVLGASGVRGLSERLGELVSVAPDADWEVFSV